jgi:hypothetical protein
VIFHKYRINPTANARSQSRYVALGEASSITPANAYISPGVAAFQRTSA